MSPRLLPLTAFVLCALGTQATAQRFEGLPVGSWANDVTPDGRIVVGTWNFGEGFIWDWRKDPAPTVIPGGDAVAVSDDGTVVAGNAFDETVGTNVASIWTAAHGWQSIGWLDQCGSYSTAYDISGDGTTIVGLSWNGCSGRGFRWTQATGMQELMNLGNGNNRCSAISGDGSVLGGFAQGNTRTPAYWDATTAGFLIDITVGGEVHGFTEDGSTSVGEYFFGGFTNTAFVRDAQTGSMNNLGKLNGNNWSSQAEDISEDGSVVVGFDVNGLAREAWVWKQGEGIISMNDRLTALGITGAPDLFVCRAVSDDGNVVVGGGIGGGGGPFGFAGFVASFSDPAQISFRTAGSNPGSYTASAPVVGANWTAQVDLSTTGHSNAVVFGFCTPLSVTLGGGQVLLTAGEYAFDLPSMTGPLAVWNTPVANNPALVGQRISTQAIHFGGVLPYALSNAQDLVLGF